MTIPEAGYLAEDFKKVEAFLSELGGLITDGLVDAGRDTQRTAEEFLDILRRHRFQSN